MHETEKDPGSKVPLSSAGVPVAEVPDEAPPAYTTKVTTQEVTTSKVATPKVASPKKEDRKVLPITAGYVRICPHQTLSFERFRRIAHLPDIKNHPPLDLLKNLPTKHHYRTQNSLHLCYTRPHHHRTPIAVVQIRYSSGIPSVFGPGFQIVCNWQFHFDALSLLGHDEARLRALLTRTATWLCPHNRLGDDWAIETILRVLWPPAPSNDPVEEYEVNRRERISKGPTRKCGHCDTRFGFSKISTPELTEQVHVCVLRFLGQGEDANESIWLNQCALPGSENESKKQRHWCVVQ